MTIEPPTVYHQFQEKINMDKKMPKEIWALHYESETGHGEWEDYSSEMATKYLRADTVNAWRPIKTAPKDGTLILLFVVNSRTKNTLCVVGKFMRDKLHFNRDPISGWFETGGKLISKCGSVSSRTTYVTHWMPMPNPPEGGRDE